MVSCSCQIPSKGEKAGGSGDPERGSCSARRRNGNSSVSQGEAALGLGSQRKKRPWGGDGVEPEKVNITKEKA
eukprot:12915664-Prorocentrum_lima.AAC.1